MDNDDRKRRAQACFEEGKRLWAEGRHGEAMTQYNNALELDPESPARVALEMAGRIMDFRDKMRLNP